jgi:hypothetical protein
MGVVCWKMNCMSEDELYVVGYEKMCKGELLCRSVGQIC